MRKKSELLIGVVCGALVTGCSTATNTNTNTNTSSNPNQFSKPDLVVNRENAMKIQNGMTEGDVKGILGAPTSSKLKNDRQDLNWDMPYPDKQYIHVTLANNHVTGKVWAANGKNFGKTPRPQMSLDLVKKVQLGMAEDQVLEILGEPVGEVSVHSEMCLLPGAPPLVIGFDQWKEGPGAVQVSVGFRDNRVVKIQYGDQVIAERKLENK